MAVTGDRRIYASSEKVFVTDTEVNRLHLTLHVDKLDSVLDARDRC